MENSEPVFKIEVVGTNAPASGAGFAVLVNRNEIGCVHCIALNRRDEPERLGWYGRYKQLTGNAHPTQEQAVSDLLIWHFGGTPQYEKFTGVKETSNTISIPLYFEELKIVVSNNLPKLVELDCESYVVFENKQIVLYIQPGASAGVVAHEAVHIANYVFKESNISLDIDNDEPYAYLLGWIVEQISRYAKAYENS